MGLAFKPNIDDLRESPALYIAKRLTDELNDVICAEPNISLDIKLETNSSKPLVLVDYKDAINEADIIVFLVAHNEFKSLQVSNSLYFCGIKE